MFVALLLGMAVQSRAVKDMGRKTSVIELEYSFIIDDDIFFSKFMLAFLKFCNKRAILRIKIEASV